MIIARTDERPCPACVLKFNVYFPEPGGCTDGDARLVGRALESEGLLEVCLNGTYRRVTSVRFGIQEAAVVCRQIGSFGGECVNLTL